MHVYVEVIKNFFISYSFLFRKYNHFSESAKLTQKSYSYVSYLTLYELKKTIPPPHKLYFVHGYNTVICHSFYIQINKNGNLRNTNVSFPISHCPSHPITLSTPSNV
ncbi:hypothetical protein HZS_6121 [Henneguya salminicola]|nr:hypothetical protein HZS_6121 [Henneguya salminicola]